MCLLTDFVSHSTHDGWGWVVTHQLIIKWDLIQQKLLAIELYLLKSVVHEIFMRSWDIRKCHLIGSLSFDALLGPTTAIHIWLSTILDNLFFRGSIVSNYIIIIIIIEGCTKTLNKTYSIENMNIETDVTALQTSI